MANAKSLYLFSPTKKGMQALEHLAGNAALSGEQIHTFEELKARLEGGQVDYLLLDGKALGLEMLSCLGEPEPERLLGLSLAELEKRHILRVLASTGGNKTRAARILGIDTKTLYNKLKSYQVSQKNRQRRMDAFQSPLSQSVRA